MVVRAAGTVRRVPVPDVSLARLRAFLAVVDHAGFTAAARQLHLSQQAVSAAVTRLEAELGVLLLQRSHRGPEPTPAGAAFAERARELVGHWEGTVAEAQRLDRARRQVLRVGAMAGAALELTEPILRAFAELEPEASVELEPHLYDDPSAGLASGSTDVAFLRPPLGAERLVLTELLVEPRVILVGAGHPLAGRGRIALDELRPFAAARPAGPDERWNGFWSAEADPAGALPVTTLEEAFELVAAGRAWAVAPIGWTRFHARPGLAVLTSDELPPSVLALGRRRGERNPLVHRFLAAATSIAARHLDLVPNATTPAPAPPDPTPA
jgi:DNA-binding transcriptional LysR family regulator